MPNNSKKIRAPLWVSLFSTFVESSFIPISAAIAQLSEEAIGVLKAEMDEKSEVSIGGFTLSAAQLKFTTKLQKLHTISFVPSVIEPSFGIGRLLYALLEHSYATRENDQERRYFTIPASIAPYKCSILPISNKPEFDVFITELTAELKGGIEPQSIELDRILMELM